MTCDDCGDAISMNEICKTPLRSATDMLRHLAAHNASRAFATVEHATGPELDGAAASELPPSPSASQRDWIDSMPESPN
jgi:hypothetical protein